MKRIEEIIEIDVTEASVNPGRVGAYFSKDPRMLAHLTSITISEPEHKSLGRGYPSTYSPRDVCLMKAGAMLIGLSLSRTRVKECVALIKEKWDKIVPGPLRVKFVHHPTTTESMITFMNPPEQFYLLLWQRHRLPLKMAVVDKEEWFKAHGEGHGAILGLDLQYHIESTLRSFLWDVSK